MAKSKKSKSKKPAQQQPKEPDELIDAPPANPETEVTLNAELKFAVAQYVNNRKLAAFPRIASEFARFARENTVDRDELRTNLPPIREMTIGDYFNLLDRFEEVCKKTK